MKHFNQEEIKKAILENVETALDQMSERYEALEERASEAYDSAKEIAADSRRKTVNHIRKNPERSVAIAAGAGALAGIIVALLFSGRRR